MLRSLFMIFVLVVGNAICLHAQLSAQTVAKSSANRSAREILQRYAEGWLGRKELELPRKLVLAFSIRGQQGGEYAIELSNDPGGAVREGVPVRYDIRFELYIDFLRRLDRGEMSALTAMGQARGSDTIPLRPEFGPEFDKLPDSSLLFRRLCFHFWTREWPEIVLFNESAAREVHGGNAAVLVYDREFRSAWYQLKPGMHINAEYKDQTNTFPQLVIVTRGRFSARLGGKKMVLSQGQAVMVPPGMAHEFWAETGEYGEIIWLAFGKGS